MGDVKLTDLELRVLRDIAQKRDPWRHNPGTTSRPISQAIGRLHRKGVLAPTVFGDVVTKQGRAALAAAEEGS